MNNNYKRDLQIERLLELCKYIKWENVESIDDLNKGGK